MLRFTARGAVREAKGGQEGVAGGGVLQCRWTILQSWRNPLSAKLAGSAHAGSGSMTGVAACKTQADDNREENSQCLVELNYPQLFDRKCNF